jgi:hypothetical protein
MASEVEAARKRVDRLREQLENEKSKAAATQLSSNDDVRVASLVAEERRLTAEIEALKARTSKSVVKESTKDLVDQVKEGGGASAEVKREKN